MQTVTDRLLAPSSSQFLFLLKLICRNLQLPLEYIEGLKGNIAYKMAKDRRRALLCCLQIIRARFSALVELFARHFLDRLLDLEQKLLRGIQLLL